MIKISFIIPVYNISSEFLHQCLNSLRHQESQECEFLIISDGASINETELCKEFAKIDSRFIFLEQKHSGVSATRNLGIKNARGEYISFIDADDWIAKNTINILISFIEKTNSDLIFWDCSFVETKRTLTTSFANYSILKLNRDESEFFQQNIIHHNSFLTSIPSITVSKCYKKYILSENHILFDESLKFGEDRVFNYSAFLKIKTTSYLKETLYFCRRHSESTTRRYTPNSFSQSLAYIDRLKTISNDKYLDLIGFEALNEFYTSWQLCYMNKENKESFFSRMKKLKSKALSDKFQNLIFYANYENISLLQKIELWLLKHHITFFIWIHGIKHLLLK